MSLDRKDLRLYLDLDLQRVAAEALGELVLPRTGTLPGELGVSEQARAVGAQLESAIE